MLREGHSAPEFTLPSSEGGTVSLADFGGKNVVVYFYPKDDTPGCTIEAREFTTALPKFRARNAAIVGISKDTINSHCKFRDKYGLTFPLLSDEDAKVIHAYGAWGTKNMYGRATKGILRTTVVVGPDGKVKKIFPKVRVSGHVEAVLESLNGGATGPASAAKTKTKASPAKAKTASKGSKPGAKKAPAKKAKKPARKK